MAPVLAFDIETIPDVDGIRRLHELPADLPDREVAEIAFQKRRTQTGSDFLPPQLHRVVVISCVLREGEGVKVFSLGEPEAGEREAIQRFYDGIEKLVPQLVSWNGGGFDLPVLNYRGLIHGVAAAKFWDQGEDDKDFRWNSYLGRYHARHLDLMDVLAMYQPRNNAPLDEVAQLAGLPGKIGMGGAKVWESYLQGEIKAIRDYCEADTANTYLLYLRFQRLRGALTPALYDKECALLRGALEKLKAPHWREFLNRWSG
ncbi:MAG: 3'-5' exonuclease [Betaproteobacteria bacterium]|nr:3'-5' exonuclease [Betaproteobacteria bacterium]MDH5222845.1 3'-5' exonuclease [Betaproteobacteria bacterium]MDH5351217.1 3'-5' exonuclease [Betaproteobacteria bacterium]